MNKTTALMASVLTISLMGFGCGGGGDAAAPTGGYHAKGSDPKDKHAKGEHPKDSAAKDLSRNNFSNSALLRMDCIVPFTMKVIACDLDAGHLLVCNFDLRGVVFRVQDAPDF